MSFNPLHASAERTVGVVIDKETRVYITGIPSSRIDLEGPTALQSEFAAYGPIDVYQLHKDALGRFTGAGMCTYRNPADARLAIFKMNGFEVDGARISAAQAKEHGVLLSSQLKRYVRRESQGDGEPREERWSHDRFEMLQRGEDPFARRGRGRGGRGGRGRGGRGGFAAEETEASFERYVTARDEALGLGIPLHSEPAKQDTTVIARSSTNEQSLAAPAVVATDVAVAEAE